MAAEAEAPPNANSVFVWQQDGPEVPYDVIHVRVPSTVRNIASEAFKNCIHLRRVDISEGILRIGPESFGGCESLTRVTPPSTLREIGHYAFAGCTNLVDITLPDTLEYIGDGAFEYCSQLAEVTLSDSVQSIGQDAFFGTNIQSLRIPSAMANINPGSFLGVHRFSLGVHRFELLVFSIELPEGLRQIDGNSLYVKNLRNVAIPQSCKEGEKFLYSEGDLVKSDLMKIFYPRGFTRYFNWDSCWDEKNRARISRRTKVITTRLQHRFDGLAMHKICYYQSYSPIEEVLQDLKLAVESARASRRHQDELGMTPLHILTCSSVHHMDMYRVLIESHPEHLITKDNWGDIPLLYAFWSNAPQKIQKYLIASHKSFFPGRQLDWEGMLRTLATRKVPLIRIKNILNTQRVAFPEYEMEWQKFLTEYDTLNDYKNRLISDHTFSFLLKYGISERIGALNVTRWQEEIKSKAEEFSLNPRRGHLEPTNTEKIFSRLNTFENWQESICSLEMALWKMKMDEVTDNNGRREGEEPPQRRARVEDFDRRAECRSTCGAGVVIPNVLRFL